MLIDRFKGLIIEGLGRVDYYIQRGLLWVWEEALENSWVCFSSYRTFDFLQLALVHTFTWRGEVVQNYKLTLYQN